MVVDVHSDAELGNDVDTVQQVQAGSLDMANSSTDNFSAFDPDVTLELVARSFISFISVGLVIGLLEE